MSSAAVSSEQEIPAGVTDRAYQKATARIVPILIAAFLAAYLDRVNVGFAKLQMASDLNFSDAIYGVGAGVFFFGYFLFELPSNLMLHRVGARVWLARIMFTWGVISALTLLVHTAWQFYAMRFVLGRRRPASAGRDLLPQLVVPCAATGPRGGTVLHRPRRRRIYRRPAL